MALYGVHDLKLLALPNGVDADELTKWKLRDGTTFDIVYSRIAQLVAAQNTVLFTDPIIAGMIQVTDEEYLEYPSGSVTAWAKATEYSFPTPVIAKTIAHTLPLSEWSQQLQWTESYLKRANMNRLESSLKMVMDAAQNNVDKAVLTRFFSPTENQINGGSGYDMPFANASSTVVYTPPDHDGQTFASSHTHFDRQVDTVNGRALAVNAGANHLFEHGIKPPYHAIIPFADMSLFVGMAETSPAVTFVAPQRTPLMYPNATTGAGFDDDRYFGYLNTPVGVVYLWATHRLPTDYMGLYKSYGLNAAGNPLVLRFDPFDGEGLRLRPAAMWAEYPIENAVLKHGFGIGISAGRLNGYAARFAASGTYADSPPTIS